MRRELKKMEKRMDREDERDLKQLEGRPKRHILRNVLLIALGTIAAALVAGYFLFDVPSWQRLDIQKITAVQQTGAIYDRNGELISALKGSEDRTLIALSSLPDHVKNAFIAAEDLRFYRHPGFDVVRIFGAVMANLRSRGFSEGASTITQQLVKLSHLSSEKTIARMLEEIYLQKQVEAVYSKDDILQKYLYYVYFGRGAYGVEAAAQAYFNCSAAELTAAQAATLAAIIKAPSAYSPQQNPESNAKRRNYILATMRDNNLLSQEEYALAAAEAIAVIPQKTAETRYGWYMDAVDKRSDDPLMLFVPNQQVEGTIAISDVRMIRGASEYIVRLPVVCSVLQADGNTMYGFSQEYLVCCAFGQKKPRCINCRFW